MHVTHGEGIQICLMEYVVVCIVLDDLVIVTRLVLNVVLYRYRRDGPLCVGIIC